MVMKWAELLMIRTTPQIAYKPHATVLTIGRWSGLPDSRRFRQDGPRVTRSQWWYVRERRDELLSKWRPTAEGFHEECRPSFHGMRIQMRRKCHKPSCRSLGRWNDYYSCLGRSFHRLVRKTAEIRGKPSLFNSGGGDVKTPVACRGMAPEIFSAV